ncbi:PrgI family protein [Candidatus Saccharibacteria bacterium]|nr:PrgI family protein [Candidatus Saccharibacteria bacterium]
MKTAIVPAQITSVEDRIAGNLTFTQLLLMICPIFVSVAMYVFLPPFLGFKNYKVVVAIVLIAACIVLAIRIRNKLVLQWIKVIATHNARPRYFVFNKNSTRYEKPEITKTDVEKELVDKKPKNTNSKIIFSTKELYAFDQLSTNSKAALAYATNKKGELYVRIQEVE